MPMFSELVQRELNMARKKHPKPQCSIHESYAVLLEEVDEFWEEVKKKDKKRDYKKILSELTQISAMAQRAAEDVALKRI
jgi:NTP pyrophosphatase (non-canonical NTP hydrolase)